jgi:hypothetical protein
VIKKPAPEPKPKPVVIKKPAPKPEPEPVVVKKPVVPAPKKEPKVESKAEGNTYMHRKRDHSILGHAIIMVGAAIQAIIFLYEALCPDVKPYVADFKKG